MKAAALALSTATLPLLIGCQETDSFLFDQSIIGRWERTPTTVPILSRIASIEGTSDEWVEYSDVEPGDLLPDFTEYRIGPGDRLTVVVFDLPEEGRAVPYERQVDTRGYIEIPQLGSLYVGGQTVSGAEDVVKNAMRELIALPLASVSVDSKQQQRFSVFGAVQGTGPYFIPTPDYRLLEALSTAGGWSEAADTIYIIRQAPLSEAARGRLQPADRPSNGQPQPSAPDLMDIINQLNPPPGGQQPPPPEVPDPNGSPGVFQPNQPTRPPIELIEPSDTSRTQPEAPAPLQPEGDTGDGNWIYLEGRWVKVRAPARPGTAAGVPAPLQLPGTASTGPLVTQRIIRVPSARLAMGDARVNLVIRPGDVIRVPPAPSGNIFIGGQIARGGTYQMADKLTLRRAIVAAGGLNAVGIPERTDLTRMVGYDRQATIRLDLRAIFEGTNPDIFLKPNDHIDVGTNFWATPLAVIRNGFRFTYGFGFVADRNFGYDIFGPPPGSFNNF